MADQISSGSIERIYQDATAEVKMPVQNPVLQVLSIKATAQTEENKATRYRLIVSDGTYYMQSMLSINLNELVEGDTPAVEKWQLVRLKNYFWNAVGPRRIMIVLELEPLNNPNEKIGSPAQADTVFPPPAVAGGNAGGSVSPQKANGGGSAPAPSKPAGGGMAGRGGGAGAARAAGKAPPIYPIEGLSPYQNKWTIKARVTTKSDIRHYSNARGDGRLFNVNLLDETGEIRATGFNENCDRLYPLLEEGGVYYVSKARVNIAKKQFSNLSNEYELMFDRDTEVSKAEDASDVPQIKYNFVDLGSLTSIEPNEQCDVLGVVTDDGQVNEITTKATQRQLKKRDITIIDRSGFQCRVTLWGKGAEQWSESTGDVVAFKGVKVSDFNGRSLSALASTSMSLSPDITEAHQLKGWYDSKGAETSFQSLQTGAGAGAGAGASFNQSSFQMISDVHDAGYGYGEKPDFFNIQAQTMYVRSTGTISYPSCPTPECKKKMARDMDGSWRCEKCDRSYEQPIHRYVLSISVGDLTGQIWLSAFQEGAEVLMNGVTADEVVEAKDDGEGKFEKYFKDAVGFVYNLRIKAKADTWNDQTRVRYQVVSTQRVDWAQAAKEKLDAINSW